MAALTVALIGGPMYDPLYDRLPAFSAETGIEVHIGFRGDHPALNQHLAGLKAAPYDLVSTHSKYAPSQMPLLAPLDGLLDPAELADFEPLTLELARIDGALYGLPRNVDVRLLHYRTDLVSEPPATWDGLFDLAGRIYREQGLYGFVFPGMESGLFGTFYELAEMAGAHLFPAGLVPDIQNEGGTWALTLLKNFYSQKITPPDIIHWHFDQVHLCFRQGQAAMVGDWPGFYSLYQDPAVSGVAGRFAVAAYPAGPAGHSLAYGGSHTFALTRAGAGKPEAVALLKFLTGPDQQLLEARRGSVPVRRSVMAAIQSESGGAELARWQTLQQVISRHVLIPPKLPYYPELEEVIWQTVQQGVTGRLEVAAALAQITGQIRDIVTGRQPGTE